MGHMGGMYVCAHVCMHACRERCSGKRQDCRVSISLYFGMNNDWVCHPLLFFWKFRERCWMFFHLDLSIAKLNTSYDDSWSPKDEGRRIKGTVAVF